MISLCYQSQWHTELCHIQSCLHSAWRRTDLLWLPKGQENLKRFLGRHCQHTNTHTCTPPSLPPSISFSLPFPSVSVPLSLFLSLSQCLFVSLSLSVFVFIFLSLSYLFLLKSSRLNCIPLYYTLMSSLLSPYSPFLSCLSHNLCKAYQDIRL